MKTRLLPLAITLLLLGPAARAEIAQLSWQKVVWDVADKPETIRHYLLYCGQIPRPTSVYHPSDGSFRYARVVNVGPETSAKVDGLTPASNWFFAVVAVDDEGNLSAYSPEIHLAIPGKDGAPAPAKPQAANFAQNTKQNTPTPSADGGCSTGQPGGSSHWIFVGLLLALSILRSRRR